MARYIMGAKGLLCVAREDLTVDIVDIRDNTRGFRQMRYAMM